MKKKDFNLEEEDDQKLIEQHDHLQIEDKGATAAERMAAAAARQQIVDSVIPPKKRSWFGWWACALLALAVIGVCIYLATRDNDIAREQTAKVEARVNALKQQNRNSLASLQASKNAAATSANNTANTSGAVPGSSVANPSGNGAGNAVANPNANGSQSANAVADANVEKVAGYPMATDSSIDYAADHKCAVDYLYYFANDKSGIASNELLDEIAHMAKETGAGITITAYASSVGTPEYNDNLCHERAMNLENYLVAHGVSADHIKIVTGGQTDRFGNPSLNRRADILVNYAG